MDTGHGHGHRHGYGNGHGDMHSLNGQSKKLRVLKVQVNCLVQQTTFRTSRIGLGHGHGHGHGRPESWDQVKDLSMKKNQRLKNLVTQSL